MIRVQIDRPISVWIETYSTDPRSLLGSEYLRLIGRELRTELRDSKKVPGVADPVETWSRLTAEWEEIYSRFLSAREARLMGEGLIDSPREDLRAAEEGALAELQELKGKMDQLIQQVGSRRPPVKDSLIIGTLESGSKGDQPGGLAGKDKEPDGDEQPTKRKRV